MLNRQFHRFSKFISFGKVARHNVCKTYRVFIQRLVCTAEFFLQKAKLEREG